MAAILVTGGAGYIGSILTAHLLGSGHAVRVFDCLLFGDTPIQQFQSHKAFEFVQGDIRDDERVKYAMRDIDAVVHLAAIVGDPACKLIPDTAREVNGSGAELLLQSALEAKVARFVFASTCSNYGRMADPNQFVNEDSELRPISLYAELKVAFEKRLLAENRDGFVPVVLRFATAFGHSPRPRFDLVVNEFTRDLYERRQLEVFGETFWRPYCHIADISEAVREALEADKNRVRGQALNVGDTNENYRKKDIVEAILKILPDRGEFVSFVARDEDPRDYRVSFEKIKQTLGFRPRLTVPDGIEQIVAVLQQQSLGDTTASRYRNDVFRLYESLLREPQ